MTWRTSFLLLAFGLTGCAVMQSWTRAGDSLSSTASNLTAVAWSIDSAVWTAADRMTNDVDRLVQNHLVQSQARQKYYIIILAAIAGAVGVFGENIKAMILNKKPRRK